MSYTKGTWNTGEQLRTHKFACSVINLHGTEDCVFDEDLLDELQDFTLSRSTATRDSYLAERDFADDGDGARIGSKAASKGSLTGLIIARYGTEDPALDDRDWELLEEWFRKGRPVGESVRR